MCACKQQDAVLHVDLRRKILSMISSSTQYGLYQKCGKLMLGDSFCPIVIRKQPAREYNDIHVIEIEEEMLQ